MAVGISMSVIGLGWIPYILATQAVEKFVIVLISTGHRHSDNRVNTADIAASYMGSSLGGRWGHRKDSVPFQNHRAGSGCLHLGEQLWDRSLDISHHVQTAGLVAATGLVLNSG